MEYGNIPGVTKPVSRLVQGTTMINNSDEAYEFGLLDAVFAEGCTTFDTAWIYAGGKNEVAVGRWVRDRGIRDQVVIIGKGAHPYDGRNRVTAADINADIHTSLERFGFEYIDLYLLHRDDPSVPVAEIMDMLNEHQRAGHIHAYGGSNWSTERLAEANAYAAANGLSPMVASSPNFSLARQIKAPWEGCLTISGPEHEADRAWYAAQHMPLFTWSSLAGGFFSGRFRRDNLDSFSSYGDVLTVGSYCVEENFERLDRAEQLGAEKGLTLPQIALAYVMSQPLDIYALTAPHTIDEYRANAAAASVRLSAEELAWLDLRGERATA